MGLIASHSSRRAFARLCVSGATGVIAGRALGSGSASAAATSARLPLSDAEWRKRLPPPAYAVLRKGATEQPFTSPLLKEHRNGRFVCAGCAQHLFSSTTKFDSGTGWPSFYAAFPRSVTTVADGSFGMQRTAVNCARCAGHLCHVFKDGPPPTGLRYCMNGVALRFHQA